MLLAAEAEGSFAGVAGGLITIPLLIVINAAFVASQFALVAMRRTRVEEMVRQGVGGARSLARALDDLDRAVAATQLGTVLAGLLLGWLGEPAMSGLLDKLIPHPAATVDNPLFRYGSAVLTFTIITFLSVVFGEMIPKTVGLRNSEGTALLVARPLLLFTRLSNPLIHFMDGSGNLILRLFGYRADAAEEKPYSVEELALLIEDSREAGVLTATQATFVTNLLRITEKRAATVLVAIEKVSTIEYACEPQSVLKRIQEGTYTRMPVYQGNIDNIIGVANTKQIMRHYTETGTLVLDNAIYPPLFVAPTDTLPHVARLMREAHYPMAVVRDGGGKVVGIVTMDDVLEEVVGDIPSERDYPVPKLTPRMLKAVVECLPKRKAQTGTATPAVPVNR